MKREALEKKEALRRRSEELRGLEKELERCESEYASSETRLKQVVGRKAKLQKARAEAESRVSSLLSQYKWLESEESEVGQRLRLS